MSATRNQIDNITSDLDTGKDVDGELPECRNVPLTAEFHRQTVDTVVPLLVRTGVYRGPASDHSKRTSSVSSDSAVSSASEDEEEDDVCSGDEGDLKDIQGHRDLPNNAELRKPHCIHDDVAGAIDYILGREEWK